MTGRRTLAWIAVVVSLATWAMVSWEHWRLLHLGWRVAGVILVLMGPLLIVYGVTLLRHAHAPLPAGGVGEYAAAPPDQWAVPAMLAPLLAQWLQSPLAGSGWPVTFLVGTRTTTLAALAVLLIYLAARLRVRYRLTITHLEVLVDGRLAMAVPRSAIIYVQGMAGNAESVEAERFGSVPGAVPIEAPGVPFGFGLRLYYSQDGRPHILVLAMTLELRQALALWLTSRQDPSEKLP